MMDQLFKLTLASKAIHWSADFVDLVDSVDFADFVDFETDELDVDYFDFKFWQLLPESFGPPIKNGEGCAGMKHETQ